MDVAIWTGLVVVLVVSIGFMGPGLWSESLDYPVINWFRRVIGKEAPAPSDPAPATTDLPKDPRTDDGNSTP